MKRQKVLEKSISPPPPLGFQNPLLPLADTYEDDDEDEDFERMALSSRRGGGGQNGARVEQDSDDDEHAEDEDDSDDPSGHELPQGKQNSQVEVRRDCPYLDTVNLQVCSFS